MARRVPLSIRIGLMLVATLALARREAVAAEAPATVAAPAHAIYGELLGKGGLFGLGYDYKFHARLAAGSALSFYVVDGQRVFALSPYLAVYLLGRDAHTWFVHVGPQVVSVTTPSPVPEWSGHATLGLGAEASSGYEYRGARLLLRAYVMVSAGAGGVEPWLGLDVGWTFP